MKYLFLSIYFVLISASLNSQPSREWVARYDGVSSSFDVVSEMGLDNSGNVYVYGSSNNNSSLYDFAIVKYDNSGNELWTAIYDGPGNNTDQILAGVTDTSGNSFVTGFITDTSGAGVITTAKYNVSGDMVWMNYYKGTLYTIGSGQDISLDKSGNIIVCAYLRNGLGNFDIGVLKYSNEGIEISSMIFAGMGNGNDIPIALSTDEANCVIVAGSSGVEGQGDNILILKYDPALNLLWQKTFNGSADSDDRASSVIVDDINYIYICGSMKNAGESFDYFYAKLDESGSTVWLGNYSGINNQSDIPSSMTRDGHGNTYITGFSSTGPLAGSEDILTIKISPAGNLIWDRLYGGSANGTDQAFDISTDTKGNIYVGGGTDRGNVQLIYVLLKYDSFGNLVWVQDYGIASDPEDFIYSVVLDNKNNVYVTGISVGIGSQFDFVTIKYSQTTHISGLSAGLPLQHRLFQNYPNPFNPNTVIDYEIADNSIVKIRVFDTSGKSIVTLVDSEQKAGRYSVQFNGVNLAAGVYYCKLETGEFAEVRKLVLIK